MHRRDFKIWEDELLREGVVNPFPPALSKSTVHLVNTSSRIVVSGLAASVLLGCVAATSKEAPHSTADATTFQYYYSNGGISAKVPTPDAASRSEAMYVNFICGPDGSLEINNTSTSLVGSFSTDTLEKMTLLKSIDRNPCDGGLTLDDVNTLGQAAVKNGFATYVVARPKS